MNKKSYLRRVRLPRTPADWLEAVMNFIFFLCGMLAVCCVVLISVYMVVSGVPAIHKIGTFTFLFGTKWASTAAEPLFGILPFILSSVYGTLGATIIGVPIGLPDGGNASPRRSPQTAHRGGHRHRSTVRHPQRSVLGLRRRCWQLPWPRPSARPPVPACSALSWCFPS